MKIDYGSVSKMTEKVFIALPQGEQGRYNDFEANIDRVITPPMTTPPQRLFGIYIANLQNTLARAFLASDFEYFWLVNDDQLYPPDTLLRLLAHRKDVVGPLCLLKAHPHQPILYTKHFASGLRSYRCLRPRERGLITEHGLSIGGGGMLLHRRVLEAIPDPWWTVTTKQNPDTGIYEQTSEDFDFCDRVEAAGFRVCCDLDISVVHKTEYGLQAVYDEAAEVWRTVVIRGEEQIVIPCAAPPESTIEIHKNIPLPPKDWKRQLQAR